MSLNDRLQSCWSLAAGQYDTMPSPFSEWLVDLSVPCLALREVLRRCGLSQPAAPLAFAYGRQQGRRLQKTMREPVAADGPGKARVGPWR